MSRYIDYYPCHSTLSTAAHCYDNGCGYCGCVHSEAQFKEPVPTYLQYKLHHPLPQTHILPPKPAVYRDGSVHVQTQHDNYSQQPKCCLEGIVYKNQNDYAMNQFAVRAANCYGELQLVTNANPAAIS